MRWLVQGRSRLKLNASSPLEWSPLADSIKKLFPYELLKAPISEFYKFLFLRAPLPIFDLLFPVDFLKQPLQQYKYDSQLLKSLYYAKRQWVSNLISSTKKNIKKKLYTLHGLRLCTIRANLLVKPKKVHIDFSKNLDDRRNRCLLNKWSVTHPIKSRAKILCIIFPALKAFTIFFFFLAKFDFFSFRGNRI